MIRLILAGAFYRWGLPGLVMALLLMAVAFWWVASALWWLVTGAVYVFGGVAGLVYLTYFIALVRYLRGRRRGEHLLEYGRRRRWPY